MRPSFRRKRREARGFSLTELMVVVVIIGILASLGIASLHKYQQDAKNVEGLAMMQSIAAAQERYRAEHQIYLNVSTDLTTYYPMTSPGRTAHHWVKSSGNNYTNWRLLGPTYSSLVQYGYASVAGLPGATLPASLAIGATVTWPTSVVEPWYVIQAKGNLDEDAVYTYLVKTSFSEIIHQENAGE